jgi:hypothetical protein
MKRIPGLTDRLVPTRPPETVTRRTHPACEVPFRSAGGNCAPVEAAPQLAANHDSGWEGDFPRMRKCAANGASQARFQTCVASLLILRSERLLAGSGGGKPGGPYPDAVNTSLSGRAISTISRAVLNRAVLTNRNFLLGNDLGARGGYPFERLDHCGDDGMELLDRIAPLASHLLPERLSEAPSILDRAPAGHPLSRRGPRARPPRDFNSEVDGERDPDDPP